MGPFNKREKDTDFAQKISLYLKLYVRPEKSLSLFIIGY